jgi:hypothetical protein
MTSFAISAIFSLLFLAVMVTLPFKTALLVSFPLSQCDKLLLEEKQDLHKQLINLYCRFLEGLIWPVCIDSTTLNGSEGIASS